jgi:hypothetical protein
MPRVLQCEICGSTFACGIGEGECWCSNVVIGDTTLAKLREQAKDCVCPSCLSKVANTGASMQD